MIEIWTKSNCPNCTRTMNLLDSRGIGYTTRNLETEPGLLEEAKRRGFAAAPVVITDTDSWCGLRVDKIATLTLA